MKLVLSNYEYHLLDDYNTKEDYDSRIQQGTPFYKDVLKDVVIAVYPPASKVSRPLIASSQMGFTIEIPLLDKATIERVLKNNVNVHKLAEQYVSQFNVPSDKSAEKFYKAGYKQCLTDNADKKFTLADMEEIYSAGVYHEGTKEGFNKAIQLLNKSKEITEWDVEVEMEEITGKPKLTNGFVTIKSIKL